MSFLGEDIAYQYDGETPVSLNYDGLLLIFFITIFFILLRKQLTLAFSKNSVPNKKIASYKLTHDNTILQIQLKSPIGIIVKHHICLDDICYLESSKKVPYGLFVLMAALMIILTFTSGDMEFLTTLIFILLI